ncbi:MmgE/PrpD family protein [Aquibium sp. LZ166]|uniref:MmgE/PrpD family protein n=1 Tax=Aquibium pacificus TaxID=3153579 RepID=A0ABV3SS12_9HYPH
MATAYRSTGLVEFLHDLTYDQLPQDVRAKARQCLLDALGCGLFGTLQPWSRILAAEMIEERSSGNCTVIGYGTRLSAPAAAMCNGLAIHGYELDDLIASSIVHPAAAVVPAALAAAEASGASGEALISGIVAGYEIMHRVAVGMGVSPSRLGFHVTSLTAPVAAAMAAGKVAGLDLAQLTSAIGLSCSAAAGIKAFASGDGGGMVKRLHLGRGAEAGVRACQLARRGFSGPPYAIDGRFGLLEIFGGATAAPERLTDGLGTRWAISDIWFKVYPICGWIQPVVQALSDMRGGRELAAEDIVSIRVGVSSYAAANNGNPAPVDTMGAQYSIPFCAALALLGDPKDPAEYGEKRLTQKAMRDVQTKVAIHVSAEAEAVYPAKFAGDVELTLADGSVRHMWVPECRGTPADPCSDAELEQKFSILARKVLTEGDARALAGNVSRIEELKTLGELTHLLGAARNAS